MQMRARPTTNLRSSCSRRQTVANGAAGHRLLDDNSPKSALDRLVEYVEEEMRALAKLPEPETLDFFEEDLGDVFYDWAYQAAYGSGPEAKPLHERLPCRACSQRARAALPR